MWAAALATAVASPSPASRDAWHASAFSLDAATLLAAASAAPAETDAPVVILVNEHRYTFDLQGRRALSEWVIYRVLDASAVDEWSSIEAHWAPWHEERPTLRARVITSDGKEHPLDPTTIAEEGSSEGSRLLYGDRRLIRAPLPSVAAGAVVEQEIVTLEKEPLFDAGRVSTFVLDRGVPVQLSRLEIDAPRNLEIVTATRLGATVAPSREEQGDRVRLVWEVGRRAPKKEREASAPSDSPQSSYIAFATGRSWARVAERYAEVVDAQIAASDLRAAVAEATGEAKERSVVIARLLAWVQKRVRYTGVEFSDASIVPRSPSQTLQRSYGDCKDKAALLVALLRRAGLPAFVALLKTGPGLDVEKTLPGLGWFDHAIVYVPGPPETWIDPTEQFASAGKLPAASQDRLALVARSGTADLLRTPAAAPSDNGKRELREFYLSEQGNSRVVETIESRGTTEISYRRDYADTDSKRAQESIEEYARSEYLAHGAVAQSHGDPADLSKPFTLRVEVKDAGRGLTISDQAVVAILPATVAQSFPYEFRTTLDESEPPPASSSRRASHRRTLDYIFFEPFVVEWQYRIHPPPGFRSVPLPESREEALGAAKSSRRFAVEEDGTVVAELRVDVGKRRLTADEFESTRAAVSKLAKAEAILVRFEQVGQAHLSAGRVKEALAEFRRLGTLHPKEALHHTQIALALLHGGLGEAAREEARRGIALEPKSAVAWRTLGWVLQHDLLGRRYRAGFERSEAIKAYRKARELDSSDTIARADLAILLEHDTEGVRYGRTADLAAAIDEYRALKKDLKKREYDVNLCLALMRAERFTELAEAARELDSSPTRDQFLILAAAAKAGTRAGLDEAARLVSDSAKRREAIETVGRTLIQLRRYPEAAAFLSEAVSGSSNAAALRASADLVGKAQRREEVHLDENDPKSLFPRLIVLLFGKSRPDPAEMAPMFASSVAKEELDPEKSLLASVSHFRRSALPSVEGPLDFIVDIAFPALRQEVEGDDDAGYRIRVSGAAGVGATNDTIFVVREDGRPRLLADARDVTPLGLEALARVDSGHLAAARRLLDWAREELPTGGGDDPLAGPVFAPFWTKGREEGAGRTRLAAAALAAPRRNAKHAIAALLASESNVHGDAERAAFDRALASAYGLQKDYDKALPLAERLAAAYPDSAGGFQLRVTLLIGLKRTADARRAAEARLQKLSDDVDALRALFQTAALEGDYAGAEQWGRRLVALSGAVAEDFNSLAWNALFREGAMDRAIEDSRRAVDLSKQANAASLHTLATLYAEVGKTVESRELILKSLDVAGRDEPRAHDWYVLGRIAEQYGETASAVAAYRKVARPENEIEMSESTYLLASRRLKGLNR
jgi:tetratricopeptide (TPR) repeat protein